MAVGQVSEGNKFLNTGIIESEGGFTRDAVKKKVFLR